MIEKKECQPLARNALQNGQTPRFILKLKGMLKEMSTQVSC